MTLEICSASQWISNFSKLLELKSILIEASSFFNNSILLVISLIISFFWYKGFGILAKSENSFTKFSICLIWFFINKRFFSYNSLFSPSKLLTYLVFKLSIVNCIGVKGFLISWANFLAMFSHASCLSEMSNLFCWTLSLSIIALKFLFKISISLSAFISGTFVFKLPFPISFEAEIRLFIEIKNLDENLIAILMDIKSKRVTTIM